MEWQEMFKLMKKGAVLTNNSGTLSYTTVKYTRWSLRRNDDMRGTHYRDFDKAFSLMCQLGGGKPRLLYRGKFVNND